MPVIDERALNVFTDGSSYPGPRRGGRSAVFVHVDAEGNEVVEESVYQGVRGATNNEMELSAVVEALKEIDRFNLATGVDSIIIFSDSMYVVDGYTRARFDWSRQKWRNRNERPVQNARLWKELLKWAKKMPANVKIVWVKGHAKSAYNKKADMLAKEATTLPLQSPMSVKNVRRKLTSEKAKIGSVVVSGQTVAIRVVESEWLGLAKTNRYRYEVLSEDSPFVGKVDFIYSDETLAVGHHYEVVVNDDMKYPQVVEVMRELDR